MLARLRRAYGRLRTVPLLGGAVSRAVWAVKGALGRPLSLPPSPSLTPPLSPSPAPPPPDYRLQAAFAAISALSGRVAGSTPPEVVASAAFPTLDDAVPRRVSVIVSTLDRASWLDRALTALAYQRHPDFETIVVAGPCVDATDDVLARHAGRIRVARCPVANLSASRNIGLRLAGGDVAAFLDDDAVPEPDWLQRLCEPYADPTVGGVGGYIRDHSGVAFQCQVMVADRFGAAAEAGVLRRARIDPPGQAVERYLSLTGTNASFRRRALLDIGGFDEAYAYFLDETDVCLRLVEVGWRLAVAPAAEVHHAYAPNAQRRADRAPRSLAACMRSKAYFAARNALARHGVEAVAEALHLHAEGLHRDTLWRADHGVIERADAHRQIAEIETALAQGVHAALSGPRRLMAVASPPGDAAPRRTRPVRRSYPDRLNICLLSQQYPENGSEPSPPGGVAIWTEALAQAMAAEGHEVTVVARAGAQAPSVRFEARDGAGVWLHRIAGRPAERPLRPNGLLAGLPPSVADPALAAAAEVARAEPRRRFDLVMGPLWDVEPIALLARGAWPVAVSLHTSCARAAAFKPEWSTAYRRAHVDRVVAAERRLLAHAPNLLANSRAAIRDIAEALDLPDLAGRAMVIPHGLPDLARGVIPTVRRPGRVQLLFVGRLELRKGIETLLAAAPRVLQAAPEAELVIVGEDVAPPGQPAWAKAFHRRHAGAPWLARVRFEGPLARADLLTRYAACDVVAVPSLYESFGLTALEAMIFAKPCVASRAGGLAEVVADGETGLLTPPGDVDTLAAALLRLVHEGGLRRRLGEAARRRYEALFTAERMAANVEAWARGLAVRQPLAAE